MWPQKVSGSLPNSLHHPLPRLYKKTFALPLRGYTESVPLIKRSSGCPWWARWWLKLGTSDLKPQGPLSALTSFPCEGLSVHRLNNWAISQPDARWIRYSMVDTLSSCIHLLFVSCSGCYLVRCWNPSVLLWTSWQDENWNLGIQKHVSFKFFLWRMIFIIKYFI